MATLTPTDVRFQALAVRLLAKFGHSMNLNVGGTLTPFTGLLTTWEQMGRASNLSSDLEQGHRVVLAPVKTLDDAGVTPSAQGDFVRLNDNTEHKVNSVERVTSGGEGFSLYYLGIN